MNERISQLMDGELDDDELHGQFCLLQSPEGRREWHAYHLIGDVLRETPAAVSRDFMDRFEARMSEEPTVLAPRRLPARSPRMFALSAAASVTAVGVVIWAVLQAGNVDRSATQLAANNVQPDQAGAQVGPYLLAHQEYSPSVAMQGMAPYVRAVSDVREVAAR